MMDDGCVQPTLLRLDLTNPVVYTIQYDVHVHFYRQRPHAHHVHVHCPPYACKALDLLYLVAAAFGRLRDGDSNDDGIPARIPIKPSSETPAEFR